jgi:predicted permease
LITGSQMLFVESRRANGSLDTLVIIIDFIAGLLFIGGIIAFIVYHWFPDPSRKFSWQRKHKDAPGPND